MRGLANEILTFERIRLPDTASICLDFREDSFVCSFGNSCEFYGEDGQGGVRYLKVLQERIHAFPGSCVHAKLNDEIVGQIEIRRVAESESEAYVNLYYLAPHMRGKGYAKQLDDYVVTFLRKHKILTASLSVSKSNTVAIIFYQRQGWTVLGPRKGRPGLLTMSRNITTQPGPNIV